MKILSAIAVAILLMSIGCAGMDHTNCYNEVATLFPNSQIVNVDKSPYKFMVKTPDGLYYYVKTMNFNDSNITKIQRIQGSSAEEKANAIIKGER